MKKLFFYPMILATLFFAACSGNEDPIKDTTEKVTHLILCEGSNGSNNSTLASFNFDTKVLDKDFFLTVNKRGLGDTGNDMLKYGSKVYIVVNVSSTIEIVNMKTGKSVGQIPMKADDGTPKQPRRLTAHNGKVYVTSFDDTVTRIDTLSLQIDGSVGVGRDPEGICISNNKIYVANSGGLDFESGNFDSTVSVIDITTFKEERKIEVGKNVNQVFADSQGDIYVSTSAIYKGWDKEANATLKRIDAKTGNVEPIADIQPGKFVLTNDKAYIIIDDYTQSKIIVYDCLTEKISTENFISDDTKMATPYSISVNKLSGDVFLTETDYSAPGNVYCFNKEGKLKYEIKAVGMNPNCVLPLN